MTRTHRDINAEHDQIRDRRMARADLIQQNVPSLCWADIVMWAWIYNLHVGDTIILDGAKSCQSQSVTYGSCYCNRFQNGDDMLLEIEQDENA